MRFASSQFINLALAAGLACSGCERGETPEASGADSAFLPAKPGDPLPAFVVPKAVPADAFAVVSLRGGRPLIDWYASAYAMGKEAKPERVDALRKELDDYLGKHWGVHVTGAHSLTAFVTPAKTGAALIHGIKASGEKLAGDPVGEVGGVPVHSLSGSIQGALIGDTLVVSDKDGLRLALEAYTGESPSLHGSDAALRALAEGDSAGAAFIGAAVMSGVPAELEALIGYTGVEQAVFRLGTSGVYAAAEGDPKKMEALAYQAKGMLSTARALAESQRNDAVQRDDVMEGVVSILAYHSALQAEESFVPKVEGRRLVMEFPLEMENSQPMITVAIVGILAAIAVPAFTKYVARSKTSEAKTNIAKIFDGVSAQINESSGCPDSPGMTPPLSVNCNTGAAGRCVPGDTYPAALWTDNPQWVAFNFALSDDHSFHYNVETTSREDGCDFRVQAFGDLDDDGLFSTFERSASATQAGIVAEPGLFIQDEME